MQDSSPTSSFESYNKIVFLGQKGVKKSLLIQKLIGSSLNPEHESSGVEYHNLELEYQNKKHYLQFWDLSSTFDEEFVLFLRNTTNIVFVFNFKDKGSQKYVIEQFEIVNNFLSAVKMTFVGLIDKKGKNKPTKEFMNWMKEKEFTFHSVFYQENEGISQLLQMIVQQLN